MIPSESITASFDHLLRTVLRDLKYLLYRGKLQHCTHSVGCRLWSWSDQTALQQAVITPYRQTWEKLARSTLAEAIKVYNNNLVPWNSSWPKHHDYGTGLHPFAGTVWNVKKHSTHVPAEELSKESSLPRVPPDGIIRGTGDGDRGGGRQVASSSKRRSSQMR